MDNTIIQQGTFTSAGVNQTIVLRSDVDWMKTYNMTTAAGAVQWDSVMHYWNRGMAVGDSLIWYHAAGSQALSLTTSIAGFNGVANRAAFTPIDSSANLLSAPIAVTAGTNATRPVYSTGTTTGLATGTIVRVTGSAHTWVNGQDFSIDTVVAATSFRLANTMATAPGNIGGAAGFYRIVAPDVATYNLFYPSKRTIANITAANPAVVTTLVDHGYTTGQVVRFNIPAVFGMTQLNGLLGTVTAINASTFSVNIDSTAFTAFAFPVSATAWAQYAQVEPVGDNALVLGGATRNQGYIGMILGSDGAVSGTPTGVANDVIYWVAGKSFNGI